MRPRIRESVIFVMAAVAGSLLTLSPINRAVAQSSTVPARVDFDQHVAPILVRRCLECHQGPDASGGLQLSTAAALENGGDSGPVVDRQDPQFSLLLDRVASGEMPPDKQGDSQRLPAAEISILRQWIDQGAEWPEDHTLDLFQHTSETRGGRDWWSLQAIADTSPPPLPALQSRQGERLSKIDAANPIDAFVLRRLAEAGLEPAPRADRQTLVRRLHYDLIGLPPSHQQVQAFLTDQRPDAYHRLVERLLASPEYGQRWARYWLDLVRYADTSGYERDQEKPFAWRYRDWVVDSLNADLAYDQFVVQQLAGDQLPEADRQSVIATGFLRLGSWNDEPNEPLDYQYDRLEDLVHTTSSAFLGLTVRCARCHSHKFDPITQEDYYRVAWAFWPGPIAPRDSALLGGPSDEELGHAEVLGWTDIRSPAPLHVLKDGQRSQPLQPVTPVSPSFLAELQRTLDLPDSPTQGGDRRLQLARWITDPDHPLTPRVIVNRLWQHHFGTGLVRTPNNFGFLCDGPTHPQLLDYLATQFQNSGGSLKQLHRLMVHSRTWQQSSLHPDAERLAMIDPGNRLWWHFERRRLDADALRDTLLACTDELDRSLDGPSFRPSIQPAALEGLSRKSSAWTTSPPEDQHRRTLYCFLKRGLLPPLLTTFDLSDATQSCPQRTVTTVPTQALALINGEFAHERSRNLASRLVQRGDSDESRVQSAWNCILLRDPNAGEMQMALRHLDQQRSAYRRHRATSNGAESGTASDEIEIVAIASLCQVLMNSNELLYVD